MAITDHDSATAFPEMKEACEKEGIEVCHPSMHGEIKERAYKIAMENNLFISGGSDHAGLCGGYYSSCPQGMTIRYYRKYLEPLSVGVEERFFRELKERKLNR